MRNNFQEHAKDVIDERIVNFERALRTKSRKGVDILSDLIAPVCDKLEEVAERYGVNRRGKMYRQVKEQLNGKLMDTMILMTLY